MADLSPSPKSPPKSPEAEAKPSTKDLQSQVIKAAYDAVLASTGYPPTAPPDTAEDRARTDTYKIAAAVVDAVTPLLIAAGRTQAAADIRAEMTLAPVVKPMSPELAAELVEYCAQLAEGDTGIDGSDVAGTVGATVRSGSAVGDSDGDEVGLR